MAGMSPTEAIEQLITDADDDVTAELLDRVLAQSPAFLERLALRLLQAMGYGGREALLTHTGKPGDAGLDGIIRQDASGLDLVAVQAKRHDRDSAVQRPEMQAFVTALQGPKQVAESSSQPVVSAAALDSSLSRSRFDSC